MDIVTLSHGELIDLVRQLQADHAAQQALIAQLQVTVATQAATIERLERRIRELEGGESPPRRMPGHKRQQPEAGPRPPRRKRVENHARRRDEPTARVVHALDVCPACGLRLAGGSVKRTREVLEIVPVPATVTEHVYLERCCGGCGKRWTPRVALADQVVGQSRLGVGLLSLIATLRAEWRLPVRAIQQYLASVHGLALSVGAIHGALAQVTRAGQGAITQTLAVIRGSPLVHADETGWREHGHNGYIWTFSIPTARYYIHGSREKGMVDRALGPAFSGVLVSDFYAAYDHYDGLQQKCWVHLLRDIRTLRRQHPADERLGLWAEAVHGIYSEAVAEAMTLADASQTVRRAAHRRFQTDLTALCAPYEADETAPQALLCRRVAKYQHALFVFLLEPGVPSDNNPAERSVRHEVIGRKISGGTRSAHGTQVRMSLATLFGTWRAQGRDPVHACHAMLTSPQV
jgi:transposase